MTLVVAPGYELVEEGPGFRAPSLRVECSRGHCHAAPVADMRRRAYYWHEGRWQDRWYAYCPEHLADYRRIVRHGRVWVEQHISRRTTP